MASDTRTVALSTDDADDEIEVPTALLDVLGEEGDAAPQIVGDVAMLGLAQQAHGIVHHGQGEVSSDLEAAEAAVMDLFEERFGQTYAEVTGHGH
jgi:hypothetical protein